MEEQKKLAELLWAANDLKEKYKKAITATDEMLKAKFREMFGECGGQGAEGDLSVSKWPLVRISEVVTDVRYGTSKPGGKTGVYAYLRMNNLTDNGGLDLTDLKRITLSGEDFEKCVVRRGDILFNRTNTKDLVGKTAYYDLDDDMVVAGYIIRVRVDLDKLDPRYLWKLMNTVELKTKLKHMAKGAIHQANINAQELQSIQIPLPPLSLQREFVAIADKAESAKANLKKSIADIDQVMKGLINQK
jgi:type I restriction enzyme S subunit